MKAFFKDSDKIIINSMDYTEALVGKQFLDNLKDKVLKVEQRNDINDDFDGLVISIIDAPVEDTTTTEPETTPTTETTESPYDYEIELDNFTSHSMETNESLIKTIDKICTGTTMSVHDLSGESEDLVGTVRALNENAITLVQNDNDVLILAKETNSETGNEIIIVDFAKDQAN